jgi:hypothetical protein
VPVFYVVVRRILPAKHVAPHSHTIAPPKPPPVPPALPALPALPGDVDRGPA